MIRALTYYLPEKILSNEQLNIEYPEWTADKITSKTGIKERHIAGSAMCASDMAYESAKKLFDEYSIIPEEIDFILFCTQSPDYFLPTTACILQDRLGIPTSAGALDFNLGCSGYIYGLSLAQGLIDSQNARNVLLLTAETYSKYIHPKDKSVRTIFGDAAAATVISASSTGKLGPFVFGTDGSGYKNLIVKTGAMRFPNRDGNSSEICDEYGNIRTEDSLYMNGGEIFNFTLRSVPVLVTNILSKANLTDDDLSLYILHQANKYMLETLRKKMKIREDKCYYYLENCGNTVSSSIPIALKNALIDGKVKKGDKILLAGFGVGYSWAGCIAEF